MRLRYIIAAVIGLAGVLFGTWNWISYFQEQNEGGRPAVQATRPEPDPEIAALEQQQQSDEQQAGQPQQQEQREIEPGLDLPDTVGRNPFLRPEEIEAIASGEFFREEQAQSSEQPAAPLPQLDITALLRERSSGNYVALIGGKTYREGDTVGRERIVEITGNSVVLDLAGRRRTVTIGGEQRGRSGVTVEMRKN